MPSEVQAFRQFRNFIQRYGGSIQEYTLFTHLFALTILFPPFWQSISHHIHICLSDSADLDLRLVAPCSPRY